MVFVVDKHKKPLMPCSEKRARQLLERGRAVVCSRNPFTIRLKDRTVDESVVDPLRLKIDPGSKVTGIAVLTDGNPAQAKTVILGEIHHKPDIKKRLDSRRSLRRNRRNRKTRYRQARFNNRHPAKCACCGKNAKHGSRYCRPCHEAKSFVDNGHRQCELPPSLNARIEQTMSVVGKIRSVLPITAISTEHVKFDTQLLSNPDIADVEYQDGTLAGYEVKEYLLEKFNHKCAYCDGRSGDPILEVVTAYREIQNTARKAQTGSVI